MLGIKRKITLRIGKKEKRRSKYIFEKEELIMSEDKRKVLKKSATDLTEMDNYHLQEVGLNVIKKLNCSSVAAAKKQIDMLLTPNELLEIGDYFEKKYKVILYPLGMEPYISTKELIEILVDEKLQTQKI